jgi:2-iminobutanoate/2-iminopropanoate deaminase
MKRELIRVPDAPTSALYSQAVKVGPTIYVTGVPGLDPQTNKMQVLLALPGDFAGLNEEYAKFFPQDPPVRSVARLGPELGGILVSIRMVAVISD